MDQSRLITFIAILLSLLIVGYFGYQQYGQPNNATPGIESLEGDPDSVLQGFEQTTFSETGRRQYQMRVDRVVHFAHSASAHLQNPRITWYSPQILGSEQPDLALWQVSSRAGVLEKASGKLQLEGNVAFAKASQKNTATSALTTESITIYPDAETAVTEAPVTVTQNDNVTTSTGFEIDLSAGTLQLRSQVRGRYVPKTE